MDGWVVLQPAARGRFIGDQIPKMQMGVDHCGPGCVRHALCSLVVSPAPEPFCRPAEDPSALASVEIDGFGKKLNGLSIAHLLVVLRRRKIAAIKTTLGAKCLDQLAGHPV